MSKFPKGKRDNASCRSSADARRANCDSWRHVTLKQMTDKLEFVFVEVAKFNKREDELETDLDKWLYLLKNMSTLPERPI